MIHYHYAASQEIDDAERFYSDRRPDLGTEFLIEISRGIDAIVAYPLAHSRIHDAFRKVNVRRFPYGIIYAPVDDGFLIVAVSHLHREPFYWLDRVTDP